MYLSFLVYLRTYQNLKFNFLFHKKPIFSILAYYRSQKLSFFHSNNRAPTKPMESFGMPRRLLVLGMGIGRQGFNCRPHWSDLALFHQLWSSFWKPAELREGHSVKETEEQTCPFTVWVSTECYSFLPHPHHASSLAVNHQVSQVLILRSGLWFLKLLISKSERKRYR